MTGDHLIYLLRHGHVLQGASGKRFIGRSDLPLSPAGIHQARQWRTFFSTLELSALFCSDRQRALETARIIAEGHRVEIVVLPELRELDLGRWEGLSFDEVRQSDRQAFEMRGKDPAGYRPPEGESFSDLQRRVMPVFERIAAQMSGRTLTVGHAGVNRVILCHLLGVPLNHLFRIGQDYAALNILRRDARGFRVEALNLPVDWPWTAPAGPGGHRPPV